jgi:hypothetical protein
LPFLAQLQIYQTPVFHSFLHNLGLSCGAGRMFGQSLIPNLQIKSYDAEKELCLLFSLWNLGFCGSSSVTSSGIGGSVLVGFWNWKYSKWFVDNFSVA